MHQLVLARVLAWLAPSSALEVGSGYGLNLLLLSMQFPGVAFSGIELTEAGIAAAAAYAADVRTPATLSSFAVGPLLDRGRAAPALVASRQCRCAAPA